MGDSAPNWMEPSFYEGIPNSEVNWAQLAQNWMAMQNARSREGNGEEVPVLPPPPPPLQRVRPRMDMPMMPPNSQFMPPMPPFFPPVPIDSGGFGGPPAGWAPAPGNFPHGPGPFPPFMPPHPPWANNSGTPFRPPGQMNAQLFPRPEGKEDKERGEYPNYYDDWNEKQKVEPKQFDSENEESGGIPQGAMAHWLAPANQWGQSGNWMRRGGQDGNGGEMPFIDQRTRKSLPAWIREGLEKAEKEKQKKLEKEMKLRVAEEAVKARRLSKGLGKFDSDSSEDENEDKNNKGSNGFEHNGEPVFLPTRQAAKNRHDVKEEPSHVSEDDEVDTRTDEEKREDALLLLRRFMTEVLLTTTDTEMDRIAADVIDAAKRKNAQPKILAKSSALAALSSLGAGSDDESEDEEKGQGGTEGDDERTPSPQIAPSGEMEAIGEGVFKAPFPVRQVGAKSKAMLNRNDDGNSATQVPKEGKKEPDEGGHASENVELESSGNRTLSEKIAADVRNDLSKKELGHGNEKKRSRGRSKSRERSSTSPKHKKSKRKSRSKERSNGSRRSNSPSKQTDSSTDSKSRSRSATPERYRRRSKSPERKRHSHHSYRERSRSPDKRSRRSDGRKRSRSKDRRSRSREKRRSRSRERHRRHSHRSYS